MTFTDNRTSKGSTVVDGVVRAQVAVLDDWKVTGGRVVLLGTFQEQWVTVWPNEPITPHEAANLVRTPVPINLLTTQWNCGFS